MSLSKLETFVLDDVHFRLSNEVEALILADKTVQLLE